MLGPRSLEDDLSLEALHAVVMGQLSRPDTRVHRLGGGSHGLAVRDAALALAAG